MRNRTYSWKRPTWHWLNCKKEMKLIKDQIFELVSRENELAEQLELEQRRNIELSQQLTLARKDAERFQCEADTSTSTLEKTLAEISSYQDQQKKNQERESIMFQQINDLTQQKQQAENEVKSCQAKLEQCQKQIINYEKNTLDLQQQLKEQSFIAEDKSRQQVEDLQQKLETMQKEEKLASKHNDYSSKQSKIERLMEQLEARLLEITDYKREIDANNVSVALV